MTWMDTAVKAFLASTLMTFALALGACNTVEGFGQDVENTGDAISEGAEEAK
jgi:predicted small secreted protein